MLQSNQYWNAKIIVENVSVVFYLNTTAVISKVISPSLRKLVAKVGKLFKKYHPYLIFFNNNRCFKTQNSRQCTYNRK